MTRPRICTWFEVSCSNESSAQIEDDLLDAETGEAFDLFVEASSLTKAVAIVCKGPRLVDKMFITCASWLLVSERALDVIKGCECDPLIRWIPTQLRNRKQEPLGQTYWLAYGAMEHDVWDWARCDCYWYAGRPRGTKEAAGHMTKGVIDPARVVSFDLFRAERGSWIATYSLRERIIEAKLTGFDFVPVGMTIWEWLRHPLYSERRLP